MVFVSYSSLFSLHFFCTWFCDVLCVFVIFWKGASPVFEKAQISARSKTEETMAAPTPTPTEPENVELPAIQVQRDF